MLGNECWVSRTQCGQSTTEIHISILEAAQKRPKVFGKGRSLEVTTNDQVRRG